MRSDTSLCMAVSTSVEAQAKAGGAVQFKAQVSHARPELKAQHDEAEGQFGPKPDPGRQRAKWTHPAIVESGDGGRAAAEAKRPIAVATETDEAAAKASADEPSTLEQHGDARDVDFAGAATLGTHEEGQIAAGEPSCG